MLVVAVVIYGEGLVILDSVLCSTILRMSTLYTFLVGLRWQALIRTSTRVASAIVIMPVAAVTLIGPITLI